MVYTHTLRFIAMTSTPKTRTNVTLDTALLREARELGLNVSSIAEASLARAIRQARATRWRAENAEALTQRAAWIEKYGPPLADLQVWKP
jgi:antitoxin CcdA